eukprot:jgi/Galph1/4683/GphlegSOOS_G3406.1
MAQFLEAIYSSTVQYSPILKYSFCFRSHVLKQHSNYFSSFSKFSKLLCCEKQGKTKTQLFAPVRVWKRPLRFARKSWSVVVPSLEDIDGRLILLFVTILHGTFSPSVRILFDLSHAPDAALFNTLRLLLSSSLYIPVLKNTFSNYQPMEHGRDSIIHGSISDDKNKKNMDKPHVSSERQATSDRRKWILAGLELGTWVFVGNVLQVVGLESTPASRAAFLVQLQTVIVPFLSSYFGSFVSRSDIFASVISICGIAVLSSGKTYAHSKSSLVGDGLEVLSAIFFSIYVIRLGHYTRYYSATSLASVKICFQALLSVVWLIFDLLQRSDYQLDALISQWNAGIASFIDSDIHEKSVFFAVVIWTGIFISGLSTLLQTIGQKTVRPSDAAVIYSTQPLWASLFSFLWLHETFQNSDWMGALLILGGAFLSAKKPFV